LLWKLKDVLKAREAERRKYMLEDDSLLLPASLANPTEALLFGRR
jgi:hypothetical protein